MKKKTFIIVLVNALNYSGYSQSPLFYLSDFNDAGVYAVIVNPARGSNTPDRISFNLGGMGLLFSSNVAKTNLSYSLLEIITAKPVRDGKAEFSEPYFRLTDKHVKHPSVFLNSEVLLPSVKVSINKKLSVFAYMKERVIGNLNNFNNDGMQLFNDNPMNIEDGVSATFRLKAAAFHQTGFGFSSTVFKKHEHLLNAGATYNINRGIGLQIIALDQFDINFNNTDLDLNSEYKHSGTDKEYYSKNTGIFSYVGKNALGKGSNTDFGLVYEYRPYSMRNVYSAYNRKGRNKNFSSPRVIRYLYRISISVKDFGRIKFSEGIKNKSYSTHTTIPLDSFKKFEEPGYANNFIERRSEQDSSYGYTIKLPAVANLAFDYHLAPQWFVNIAYTQNLRFKEDGESFIQPGFLQLSLRKESDRFSFAIPVYVVPSQRIFNLGFLVKAGPLFISTYNIRSLVSKQLYGFSMAAGVVFTMRYQHDPTIESNNW